jgi:alkanesulfonate monooxygenase SsuD/methylene tetrahydromethanopterin reductase-like flavin-dependent oxidoreductase (luciferase family)
MRAAAVAADRDPDQILVSSAGAVFTAPDAAAYRNKLAAVARSSAGTVEDLEAHFSLRNTPRGPADQVREELARIEAAGATRFYLQTLDAFDEADVAETVRLIRNG